MTPESRAALKRKPELLYEHLLGAVHAGPGLLVRVRERVEELGYEPGPSWRSGSITGQTDHTHNDPADEDHVFKLYMGIKGWLGRAGSETDERTYLRSHRMSDADALLSKGERGAGLIVQARRELHRLFREPTEMGIARVMRLAEMLMDWMGGRCLHLNLEPIAADEGITVLACSCGVRVHEDRRGNWLAV